MKKILDVRWEKNMKFVSNLDGHQMVLDSSKEFGGNDEGPRPKGLLMLALAGCTGMDVVSILAKMKVKFTYFNLRIEADLRDEHPKKYERMTVIYEFKGDNLDYEKIEKAVNLSVEKYCSVSANFRDAMVVDHEIRLLK